MLKREGERNRAIHMFGVSPFCLCNFLQYVCSNRWLQRHKKNHENKVMKQVFFQRDTHEALPKSKQTHTSACFSFYFSALLTSQRSPQHLPSLRDFQYPTPDATGPSCLSPHFCSQSFLNTGNFPLRLFCCPHSMDGEAKPFLTCRAAPGPLPHHMVLGLENHLDEF